MDSQLMIQKLPRKIVSFAGSGNRPLLNCLLDCLETEFKDSSRWGTVDHCDNTIHRMFLNLKKGCPVWRSSSVEASSQDPDMKVLVGMLLGTNDPNSHVKIGQVQRATLQDGCSDGSESIACRRMQEVVSGKSIGARKLIARSFAGLQLRLTVVCHSSLAQATKGLHNGSNMK